jgi:hypothetical protein
MPRKIRKITETIGTRGLTGVRVVWGNYIPKEGSVGIGNKAEQSFQFSWLCKLRAVTGAILETIREKDLTDDSRL